jgi:hypothetical protein
MGNKSLARTVILWAIAAIVAIVAVKIVIGIIAGLFQFVFALALLALIAYAVIWALRKL